jgi:hypothetical protein
VLEGLVLESFTRMNQRGRHSQLQIRPSLQFSAKAAIQTASMMFSILRRKVARLAMVPLLSRNRVVEFLDKKRQLGIVHCFKRLRHRTIPPPSGPLQPPEPQRHCASPAWIE